MANQSVVRWPRNWNGLTGRRSLYLAENLEARLFLSLFQTQTIHPTNVASPPAKLYVTEFDNGTIGEYDTSGATINTSLISGLNGPEGIAGSGADLFVTNKLANTLGEYANSGAAVSTSLITGLNNPVYVASSGSDLFVANYTNAGTVGEYTAAGAVVNARSSLV